MRDCQFEFPEDFEPIPVDRGTYWTAGYRVPWGTRTLRNRRGKPVAFKSQSEATIAACKAAMSEFRNRTTGWTSAPLLESQKELERVFGG